jgi:hypothetical protein
MDNASDIMSLVVGALLILFLGAVGLKLVTLIWSGKIDLKALLLDENSKASLSRFQFLIFTVVIALSLFLVVLSADPPGLPDIPSGVYALLGISGGSYAVSKGIQANRDTTLRKLDMEAATRSPPGIWCAEGQHYSPGQPCKQQH